MAYNPALNGAKRPEAATLYDLIANRKNTAGSFRHSKLVEQNTHPQKASKTLVVCLAEFTHSYFQRRVKEFCIAPVCSLQRVLFFQFLGPVLDNHQRGEIYTGQRHDDKSLAI